MGMRERMAPYGDTIRNGIRSAALSGMMDKFGGMNGTSKILGYVCGYHDNDDPDPQLRNTVDVQEYDYDAKDYNGNAVGFHEGVKLSAIQGNTGMFVVPQLYSNVVIVSNPHTQEEYVLKYTSAQLIQMQSVDEVNLGVTEYEPFVENERGIEKDYYELDQAESKNRTNTVYKCDSIITKVEDKEKNLLIEEYSDKMVITRDKVKVTIQGENMSIEAENSLVNVDIKGMTVTRNGYGLKRTLEEVLDEICKLTVQTAVGPSSVPINSPEFQRLKREVSNYMEN